MWWAAAISMKTAGGADLSDQLEQMSELGAENARITQADRPPSHISVKAGDKIWVNRRVLNLIPDKTLSDEHIEVIDVVEK